MTRRIERLNELLREEISELLRRGVKDPRIGGLVTITEVDISPDLRNAKVYVSVMGTDEERVSTMLALRSAAHFIQRELRRRLTLRRTPELTFLKDVSLERGAELLALLDKARDEQGS